MGNTQLAIRQQAVLRSWTSRRSPCRIGVAAALAAFLAVLLAAPTVYAGVEFVARIGQCNVSVDRIGDGKDLFIVADQNVRFEVFGDALDLVNPTSGFRIAVDSGAAAVTARIVRRRGGAENSGRGCPFKGSAEVEVDSPVNLASNVQRSLFFKMPLGDESRLQMTIKPYPAFDVRWSFSSAPTCIVKTGSSEVLDQSSRLVINLPPGHREDATNCSAKLTAQVVPTSVGEIDITRDFDYVVSGLPAFLTRDAGTAGPLFSRALNFTINTAGIRALTATSDASIGVRAPHPNRTDALRLVVVPNLGNGFAAVAMCNPKQVNVGDLTDCKLQLASAPSGNGQPITWRMTTASCFTQAVATAPYDAARPFQVFSFPAGLTSANIRVRSVAGGGCADLDGVKHTFEAWIGDFRADPQVTAPSSGPTFTRAMVNVVQGF